MTKEQEVIKYIETRIKICNENADICDDNDFDEEATYLREESYMLETVLSMLKENSAEIEQKNTELAEKNAEIERLNRQKDLMAEEIEKGDIEFTEYCNFKIVCDRNCKECIKQYFEREVNSSEQN